MADHPVLRVGGHDNTIVRRVPEDEPNHAHVDDGGDRWFAVTRTAGDAALIVEAVNGLAVEVAAEVETVRRACELRIADLQAEIQRHYEAWDRHTERLQSCVSELDRQRTAVLAEHTSTDNGQCHTCSNEDAGEAAVVYWPCPTARALGVEGSA